jgi:hypothetical protein
VPADPDILGLGVRLGLYFQVSTNLVIGVVRPEETAETILPTGLFVASLLIAVCYSTIRNDFPPGSVISCAWYPVLISVLMPFDLMRRFSLSVYNEPRMVRRRPLGSVLSYASVCINIWFWFKGLDAEHPAQCMEPRVFFFANLSAYGDIRTFFKIVNVGYLIVAIVTFIWSCGLGLGTHFGKKLKREENAWNS